MMENIPDHPVIAKMERYGYPEGPNVVHQCSWCGEPIRKGDTCFNLEPYGWCCSECMSRAWRVAGDYDG